MKLLIVRNTVADGKVVEADQVIDASEKTARTLIRLKKAVEFTEPAKPEKKKKGAEEDGHKES